MFSTAGDTSDKASVLADEMPSPAIDLARDRFPFCIVWTPIPCLTWFFPFLGHMGICTSSGIIRDFAGPYYVSEDHMAFGRPTRYWLLNPSKARDGVQGWDRAVAQASDEYKGRMVRCVLPLFRSLFCGGGPSFNGNVTYRLHELSLLHRCCFYTVEHVIFLTGDKIHCTRCQQKCGSFCCRVT
ncbi:unnamed protein product [Ixodes pacificus]